MKQRSSGVRGHENSSFGDVTLVINPQVSRRIAQDNSFGRFNRECRSVDDHRTRRGPCRYMTVGTVTERQYGAKRLFRVDPCRTDLSVGQPETWDDCRAVPAPARVVKL